MIKRSLEPGNSPDISHSQPTVIFDLDGTLLHYKMHCFKVLIGLLCLIPIAAGAQSREAGGEPVRISVEDKIHGFGKNYDPDIYSPKSAVFSKDGKKIYVNSLEGGKTVVYDSSTREKLKTISHTFNSGQGDLWLEPSEFYSFTHYPEGRSRSFMGKPVEGALSKDGRYLFVSYYRRTFDINAQDPSAIAVIDTATDEIVLMIETGPLPKMVKVSNDGKLLAVTHWGDNTVGLIDISDKNPKNWRYLSSIPIGRKLNLNFSLDTPVNRDANSGFLLRGTAFLPGDSILLVGGMAGPLAVIDVRKRKWLGGFSSLHGVRHLTAKGGRIYMSRNSAGELVMVPVDSVVKAIGRGTAGTGNYTVNGIERVKVGAGARTLQVSPSGRFVFIACNNSSEIVVVDAEEKKVINRIAADSYPVGLDISPDGLQLVSTSQGHNGIGGNAVNFFRLEYAIPEVPINDEAAIEDGPAVPADTTALTSAPDSEARATDDAQAGGNASTPILAIGIGILLLGIILFAVRLLRHRRQEDK